MIKSFTAYTQEIDDVEFAVSEILEQLDLSRLCKNSIGLLSCYSEFIDTGIVKELCNRLPFDVIGCTTLGNSTNGNFGMLELNLMVLTGDDVEFSSAVSASLSDKQDAPLRSMYSKMSEKISDPSLMIAYMPLMFNVAGEVFLDILNDASNGLPVFGTLAVDHTADYHESKVIYNGDTYTDVVSAVIVSGNVSPKFLIASVSDEKTLKQKTIITDSDANILKEVNGSPVIEYMESLGLTRNGQIEGPSTIPFVVDFNDGTKPVIRAIFAQTPEGYAVCGGTMPINSTLSIGSIGYDDVIETTGKIIDEIAQDGQSGAVIMFSCIGRNYALGTSVKDEMKAVEEAFGKTRTYQMTYSGGEICPLYDSDKKTVNRFHNDTIVVCVL